MRVIVDADEVNLIPRFCADTVLNRGSFASFMCLFVPSHAQSDASRPPTMYPLCVDLGTTCLCLCVWVRVDVRTHIAAPCACVCLTSLTHVPLHSSNTWHSTAPSCMYLCVCVCVCVTVDSSKRCASSQVGQAQNYWVASHVMICPRAVFRSDICVFGELLFFPQESSNFTLCLSTHNLYVWSTESKKIAVTAHVPFAHTVYRHFKKQVALNICVVRASVNFNARGSK